jgi:hypothetical protein
MVGEFIHETWTFALMFPIDLYIFTDVLNGYMTPEAIA